MTITYDSDFIQPARRPWWLFEFLFGPARPARAASLMHIVEPMLPRRADRADAAAQQWIDSRPLTEFAPKPRQPEPEPPEPKGSIGLDPIADLKERLRTLTYGDFILAAKGMGFEPQAAWTWATT